ncbi:MAG: tRNA1(Val) (adenine(37)-N6)-methyltransferase [Deltaproteobacteria bacterium]
MNQYIKPNERIDDLQIKGLKIIQNPEGFCFGMDAVLLSGFAKVRKDSKVVDLGCGTGIISILIAGKTEASSITGVELQEPVAEMAQRSIEMNQIGDRVKIINADLKAAPEILGLSSMDAVVTNPPYRTKDCGMENPDDVKAISRHEVCCTLEDVIVASKKLLKPGGKLFMVHRPDRLADIIYLLRQNSLEPKRLQFVHPRPQAAPNMILVEALRSGGKHLKVEKPLYIYEEGTKYSKEVLNIYGL